MANYKELLEKDYERAQPTVPVNRSRPKSSKREFKKHLSKLQLIVLNLALFLLIVVALVTSFHTFLRFDVTAVTYFVSATIAAFLLFGADKTLASAQSTRIPEWFFYIISILGGSLGILVGSQIFRHKTLKIQFLIWPGVIFVMQLVLLGVLIFG
ncbi:DUF1294 domain-containing protein [candidate division WWE3 bacterium]|uniref:DUF1294 domain-containing protein n=1 Tax=candidate division WWE3 bacterium TaxID=2053526 RepID=A0A955LKZ0_UNCKA|nr:DUF1294 domain-containing protein [candidate division WWE3 bacterium]